MYREPAPPVGICPRCRSRLARREADGVPYRRCRCGGVFVTAAELARLWELMTRYADDEVGPMPPLQARPSIYALPCPDCGSPMARVDLLGIPIDRCAIDGLWFDPPELETALLAAALPFHDWLRRFAVRIRHMK
jgi:Zn-finger nucleic acid-binding protein